MSGAVALRPPPRVALARGAAAAWGAGCCRAPHPSRAMAQSRRSIPFVCVVERRSVGWDGVPRTCLGPCRCQLLLRGLALAPCSRALPRVLEVTPDGLSARRSAGAGSDGQRQSGHRTAQSAPDAGTKLTVEQSWRELVTSYAKNNPEFRPTRREECKPAHESIPMKESLTKLRSRFNALKIRQIKVRACTPLGKPATPVRL